MDAQQLKNLVSFTSVMRGLAVHPARRGHRIDCIFCVGDSKGTFDYDADRGLWHCFRCGAGGDVYTLIERVNRSDFLAAKRWLADLAGVSLGSLDSDQLARERNKHERIRCDVERLKQREDDERRAVTRELHLYYRINDRAKARLQKLWPHAMDSAEADEAWVTLSCCLDIVRRLLAAHAVLSFSPIADRVGYLSAGPSVREQIVDQVLNRGHVPALGGGIVEVCAS